MARLFYKSSFEHLNKKAQKSSSYEFFNQAEFKLGSILTRLDSITPLITPKPREKGRYRKIFGEN